LQDREERAASSVISRHNLLSLYLPAFALSIGTGIATPAIPVYARSFGVDFAVASLVVIIHTFGGLAATFPTGYMIDRIGRRPVLLAGPLLTALTSLLTAFASSFPELLFYRFVGGVAQQMWQESRLAIIADRGSDRQRGRQITWMLSMQRTGQLWAPALGGFIAAGFDVRVPFIIHAVMSLIAVIPSFLMIKETMPERRKRGQTEDGQEEISDWRRIWNEIVTPQMRIFLTAQFLANVSRGHIRGGILLLYATYAYGVGPEVLGGIASVNAVAGIPIGFASGYIMDRFGRKATIVPGFFFIFAATAFMAATAFFAMPFEAWAFSFFLVNASQSLTGGNMQVLGSDLAPAYARGRFFAFWRMIGEAGSFVSPSIVAALAAIHYALGFSVLSGAALGVSLLIGVGLRETLGREERKVIERSDVAPDATTRDPAPVAPSGPGP
jgi:MFS family permease